MESVTQARTEPVVRDRSRPTAASIELGAPALFGRLIDSGRAEVLFWGYVAGAGLMIVPAAVEVILGVDSERKSLEDVASPLTAECGT